jgi:hypothetical protein
MLVAEHDPIRTFEQSFEISVLLQSGSIHVDPGAGEVTHAPDRARAIHRGTLESFGSFESSKSTHTGGVPGDSRSGSSPVINEDPSCRGLALDAVETSSDYSSLESGDVTRREHPLLRPRTIRPPNSREKRKPDAACPERPVELVSSDEPTGLEPIDRPGTTLVDIDDDFLLDGGNR